MASAGWIPAYSANLAAYCWRCWHRRLTAWLATALAVSAVLSLAACAELFLVLSQRSLAQQARSASEFQIFLTDDAQQPQVDTLQTKIGGVHGVKSVRYRSKSEALSLARHDPTLSNLASTTPGNPFPASLVVQLSAGLPGVERTTAEQLVAEAHQICPYSNAIRGNVDVHIVIA